jgi:hypothetical protein
MEVCGGIDKVFHKGGCTSGDWAPGRILPDAQWAGYL